MSQKLKFKFDPFDLAGLKKESLDLSRQQIDTIYNDAADLVLEKILFDVGNGKSPVTGKNFPKLDKKYIANKKREGGTILSGGGSNLELHGDLIDSLQINKKGNKLELTVSDSQAAKAYGHNTGFEGHPTIKNGPKRKFIPMDDETLRPDIRKSLREMIKRIAQE